MAWITEYWYILLLGLIAAMFLFGHRTKGIRTEDMLHHKTTHTGAKGHKNGHGCCGG